MVKRKGNPRFMKKRVRRNGAMTTVYVLRKRKAGKRRK